AKGQRLRHFLLAPELKPPFGHLGALRPLDRRAESRFLTTAKAGYCSPLSAE
ncbi:unnamed protein product, partial [Effrenium voratum]